MNSKLPSNGSTTDGLPVAPSLSEALIQSQVPPHTSLVSRRTVYLSLAGILIGALALLAAQVLVKLIVLITNITYFQDFSFHYMSPAGNTLGWWIVPLPAIGGIVVGLMARYGSKGIRGHGIPEAMEQILTNQSRVPPRLTFLKPLSAAVAIGTGGPFGAEGPIIATGGSLGSLLGQMQHTTAAERKTLLACGAAAGMAAIFGTPVAAVLLAIELLLFEYRPRSIIPVALASATAAGLRIAFEGGEPVFPMPEIHAPGAQALFIYILLGGVMGLIASAVTHAVYVVEDAFEKLPVHWMWWPALGGLAVGFIGVFAPRTLGVGYDNITDVISGRLTLGVAAVLCVAKFASWSIALGSGTSGGTLAPLLTIGGALGLLMGAGANVLLPGTGVDPRIAALVGMAAIFAGASRAMLTSAVFAFEATLQPLSLLPLLAGCATSYLISSLLTKQSIMTEKIVRRGVRVPAEYSADSLDQMVVSAFATREVIALKAEDTVAEVRAWLADKNTAPSHQGFPVVTQKGLLIGVLTRRTLLDPAVKDESRVMDLVPRPPVVVYDDCTLRDAADHMARHNIGRLPVVRRGNAKEIVGIVTRSDILASFQRRIEETSSRERSVVLPLKWLGRASV